MQLYYSPGACSLAAHIVLEEVGQPYTLTPVLVHKGETRQEAFLKTNPKGRVPVLVDGDQTLTELPAILIYLGLLNVDKCIFPTVPLEAARAVEWLNWLSSHVHSQAYGQVWRPMRLTEDKNQYPSIVEKGMKNIQDAYQYIESRLIGKEWALGSYSCVDPFLLVFYMWGSMVGIPMKQYIAWTTHARQMIERQAVQRALRQEGLSIAI